MSFICKVSNKTTVRLEGTQMQQLRFLSQDNTTYQEHDSLCPADQEEMAGADLVGGHSQIALHSVLEGDKLGEVVH